MAKANTRDLMEQRRADERGAIVRDAEQAIALVYPSPYHVAMSSLGFQTIYRTIHAHPDRAAHRAFLPDDDATEGPVYTYEANRPIADYPVLAFSVAYETELAGVVQLLERNGIPALSEDRKGKDYPFILAGGPLTFSNPLPLAPFVDAIVMGEADEEIHRVLDVIFAARDRDAALQELASLVHVFVPSMHGDLLRPVGKATDEKLPAFSQIITPHTELRNMFLIEPERGCHRGCTYCVMRRSTNGGMRVFDKDTVLSLIPEHAERVGLVGAATTDHPQICDIVEAIVDSGRGVGLSSLRADRLNDRFVAALKRGGHKGLTTASDGASQRMRDLIHRKTNETHLTRAAELARKHGMKRMKLYMMIGLPEETEDDINELVSFCAKLSTIIPLALGIAPFVAKRNTPLDRQAFAGTALVEKRLDAIRKGLRGRVDVRATSARWAWIEYVLAQGGRNEGRAVYDAVKSGGKFADWKRAFQNLGHAMN